MDMGLIIEMMIEVIELVNRSAEARYVPISIIIYVAIVMMKVTPITRAKVTLRPIGGMLPYPCTVFRLPLSASKG
jgi:hypothetical protein